MHIDDFITQVPTITADETHIWCLPTNLTSQQISQLTPLLAIDEQNRANKFYFDKHKNSFIASRGYLRLILAKYLNIQPQNVEFNYTSNGKPYLAESCQTNQLQFNVSHSQELVIYGISPQQLIGVDLEYLRPFPEAVNLAKRYFCPEEAQIIENLPLSQQSLAFFQAWTAKEAVLKAMGLGIVGGLDSVEVEVNPTQPAKLYTIDGDAEAAKDWSLVKLTPTVNYLATVAQPGKIIYKLFNYSSTLIGE